MSLSTVPAREARRPPPDGTDLDTPDHERFMLLELATDLQRWPARNIVFRRALDRAAQDLARMASETATGA